jgi:hypothetical protein
VAFEHGRLASWFDGRSSLGLAALAQSVERFTRNEKVVGSIPTGGSTCGSRLRHMWEP